MTEAIASAEQPPVFDVSALEELLDPALSVKNLYYGILSDQPKYKYAYDLTASVEADGLLHCTISYMPYRTGNFPADFQGAAVNSLGRSGSSGPVRALPGECLYPNYKRRPVGG